MHPFLPAERNLFTTLRFPFSRQSFPASSTCATLSFFSQMWRSTDTQRRRQMASLSSHYTNEKNRRMLPDVANDR